MRTRHQSAILATNAYDLAGEAGGGIFRAQVFYLLLIPWALSCAAFLFGAMRGYARFARKEVGNTLELGGPVVLFCLVIIGGYKLVPQPSSTFDLTVRPYSKDEGDGIFRAGKITIDFDTDRRTESIDSAGEANFKGIPSRFQGATLKILPHRWRAIVNSGSGTSCAAASWNCCWSATPVR